MASSRSSARSPSQPDLLGCEVPRIFTPPLRKLTPKTSLGFALIEFATEILGIELYPWQKWLAIHTLELLPDGTFRFRTVVLLVARQNGKSTFLQVLALFFLYCRSVGLVIGTAQNLDIAEEVWQGAVDMASDVPDLAAQIQRVVMVNGKKALELRDPESRSDKVAHRYKVQAANRRGGRGLSGDLVMLDELREHQSWDAWAAVSKTTLARSHAQVWAASNAGDATSVVLHYLRLIAHQSLGDPDGLATVTAAPDDLEVDDDSLGIFEWSAPPGCDLNDPAGTAQANPSLGYSITMRAIRSALRTDPEPIYRTEVLCQWVDQLEPDAFDVAVWSDLGDPSAERGRKPVFAVATAPDRSWSAIAVAWKRADGLIQVMLADYRPDTTWVAGRVEELKARWSSRVLVDVASHDLVVGAEEPSQAEQATADNWLHDAVLARTVRHGNEPALNMALRGARWRPLGETRVLDRKGSTEISPVRAAALAAHAAGSTKVRSRVVSLNAVLTAQAAKDAHAVEPA